MCNRTEKYVAVLSLVLLTVAFGGCPIKDLTDTSSEALTETTGQDSSTSQSDSSTTTTTEQQVSSAVHDALAGGTTQQSGSEQSGTTTTGSTDNSGSGSAGDKQGQSGHLVGDVNCDGVVNSSDINAFVLAIQNPAGFAAKYPNCGTSNADINGDGAVNFGDIDAFVAAVHSAGL